jgi:Uncharacterized protein conserved in bacteria (DUF2314)
VFIDGFTGDVLTGTLENEPLLMMRLKRGDRVEVRLNEIEDVREIGKKYTTETGGQWTGSGSRAQGV